MRLAVFFSGALLGPLAVTPTATESMSSPGTTSHRTTKSHRTTTQRPTTTTRHTNNTTGTASRKSPTATRSPATTSNHQNATAHPTSNSTATSPGPSTRSPHPEPPPSPSPSPGSKEAIGDYTWNNGSQPCVRLQAQIQMRVLYPTQGGGEAWGISVLNPNRTKAQGGCEGPHSHLLLSFPYGQLSFGFKQDPLQSTVYLNNMAVKYNVSFPQAVHEVDILSSELIPLRSPNPPGPELQLQKCKHHCFTSFTLRSALPEATSCSAVPLRGLWTNDKSILLPVIIVLILLGLLTLVRVTFRMGRRRPRTYQPL